MATATKQQPTKDPANSAVRVEIFDQAYNLRGSDPEYILKLAEYVDTKMRAVSEQTHTVDTSRLAVLAALNIADEYHLLKRNCDVAKTCRFSLASKAESRPARLVMVVTDF